MMERNGAETEILCERATEIAALLKLVANEQRLLLLCRLKEGEASVGEMVGLCDLSQSSVSQHLARMRDKGIVKTRREHTTIYYSIADAELRVLLEFLCERFGKDGVIVKMAGKGDVRPASG